MFRFSLISFLMFCLFITGGRLTFGDEELDIIFQIGRPDAVSWEFHGAIDWFRRDESGVSYRHVVGKNRDVDWVVCHLSTRDFGNAGHVFTNEIEFQSPKDYDQDTYFILGFCFVSYHEPSLITVKTNGIPSVPVRQPDTFNDYSYKPESQVGIFESLTIPIPAGAIKKGKNVISITLEDGSYYLYDYLVLRERPIVLDQLPIPDLINDFRAGPMKGVDKVIFAVRRPGTDPHWYSNFGYYADDANEYPFPLGSGGALQILDLNTRAVQTIFEDRAGNIRDPQVHYVAQKILFSYLPVGKKHYNLYEIDIDGSNLRQITAGDWDDIEPTYLPNDDIVFCSARSKRWVQCAASQVATLYRCGPNGENIHPISTNNDHDNTPWVLPNGQIIYMRWEYIDRSQMDYHHLWTVNPDGTKQMVYFGNYHPGMVMLAPKPIPDSNKIVACFSPGHGIREHYGRLALVDPRNGPDDLDNITYITGTNDYCDPWAFSENALMAASYSTIKLLNDQGYSQTLYELPDELRREGFWIGEPRPLIPRERETIVADQSDLEQKTGTLILADIYKGRQLGDLPKGTIRDLLILEPLSAPIHYNGGMEMISAGGTFALTRIIGTVPVTEEGVAYMELPALRNFFFVARDQNGDSVKRMHSFTSVMPGETTTCIGCHESRTETPNNGDTTRKLIDVIGKMPSIPTPIAGIPDIFDFPRDIQPILDKHCVGCHNDDDPTDSGKGINFSSDWTPYHTISYLTLSARQLLGDNRNRPKSDFSPYEIGTKNSKLLQLIDEHHQDVELSPTEKELLRYWIEAGANFSGTYAANFRGVLGYHYNFGYLTFDTEWSETIAMGEAINRRCGSCHDGEARPLIPQAISDLNPKAYSPIYLFNISYSDKSRILKAPLSQVAGGWQRCSLESVFADQNDPDYQTILAGIERAKQYIEEESNHFTSENFVPHPSYIREMIRYGIIPSDHDYNSPINPYQLDRLYWETSLQNR